MLWNPAESPVLKYEQGTPVLDVRQFFAGELEGYGMIQDWKGKMVERFTFTMQGQVVGDELTLNEQFTFSSGKVQKRTWVIKVTGGHKLTGQPSDGVGGAEGEQYGNAANLRYTLALELDGSTMNLTMDDWMFMQLNGEVLNVTKLKKFGLPVAKLSAVIRKKA